MGRALPDYDLLHRVLECDFETGKLTWRERSPSQFRGSEAGRIKACKLWNASNAGNEAFTINSWGYKIGYVGGERYLAHRIIWKMATGSDPDVIDHKNRNRSDNRISNLVSGSISDNQKNMKTRSDNTSGYTGVCFNKKLRKPWEVTISIDKKPVRLGRFMTLEEAIEVRKAAEIQNGYRKYETS